MKLIFFLIINLCATFIMFAQNQTDSFLKSVTRNNKAIISNQHFGDAKKLSYRTGLYPKNPEIEYNHLWGNPKDIGNQTEFNITQSFDFPMVYYYKNKISNRQAAKIEHEQKYFENDIQLQARLVCYELIILNKRKIEITQRLQDAEKYFQMYQQKFTTGDVSVVELNKAKLNLLAAQNEHRLNETERYNIRQDLKELNGGNDFDFTETSYPPLQDLLAYEAVLATFTQNSHSLQFYESDVLINNLQLKEAKANWFPKFELGYRSEKILHQSLRGFHLGMTIPLWEGANTIQHQKINSLYSVSSLEAYKIKSEIELGKLYNRVVVLRQVLDETENILKTANNKEVINQMLEVGQISFIEYLLETSYLYKIIDDYLQTEKEYNITVAKLHRYESKY
ncbi:MAG: TolC family protein [Bacteroidota bacterium]|nr:TolC family protein [Bacteroidota bacterium]